MPTYDPETLVEYAKILEEKIDAAIRILSDDRLPLQSRVNDARSVLAR